ncbi:MAG: hypothetical protein ACRDM1_02980, partial [Gaiellaceae bacterium]
SRPIHSATNYDEDVYLAAVDALRHGQALGSDVFAAQFPGFYDLLRAISYATGIGVAAIRSGFLAVMLLGTVGGWLVGRRFGGVTGGLRVAAFLVIAPPLDLFGYQVIADTQALALTVLALGLATLAGPLAALLAGLVFAAAFSVKLTAVTVLPALLWLLGRRIGVALAGFAAVVAALAIGHAHALGDLWAQGVSYHTKARGTPQVIPHPHRQILHQIPQGTPFYALAILAVVVGVAFFVLRRPLRAWPVWTWVVLGVAFLLVQAPLHYNHLVVFPFSLAVAAGATLGAAVERLPRLPTLVCTAVLAIAVAGGWVQQLHRVDLARAPAPTSNVAAARALARLTPPGALTVDDRPIISFLARRRVVGPLVDLALLRFETGSLTDGKVTSDLPQARAVVVSRTLRTRPAVLRYVRAHYAKRYDAGGVRIYVRARR